MTKSPAPQPPDGNHENAPADFQLRPGRWWYHGERTGRYLPGAISGIDRPFELSWLQRWLLLMTTLLVVFLLIVTTVIFGSERVFGSTTATPAMVTEKLEVLGDTGTIWSLEDGVLVPAPIQSGLAPVILIATRSDRFPTRLTPTSWEQVDIGDNFDVCVVKAPIVNTVRLSASC